MVGMILGFYEILMKDKLNMNDEQHRDHKLICESIRDKLGTLENDVILIISILIICFNFNYNVSLKIVASCC